MNKILDILICLIITFVFVMPITAVDKDNEIKLKIINEKNNHSLNEFLPVFLYFYSDNCDSCENQKPIIYELKEEYKQIIEFIYLNCAQNVEIFDIFNVELTPTMVIISEKDNSGYIYQDFHGFTDKFILKNSIEITLDYNISSYKKMNDYQILLFQDFINKNQLNIDNIETYSLSADDLILKNVEPVQVVYDAPLVKDKPTVFKVKVESTFNAPIPATISLELPEDEWKIEPWMTAMTDNYNYPDSWIVTINPGLNEIMIPYISENEKNNPYGEISMPEGIIEWVYSEHQTYNHVDIRNVPTPICNNPSYTVSISTYQNENEANNEYSETLIAHNTKKWRFLIVKGHIRESNGEYKDLITDRQVLTVAKNQLEYLVANFPIADSELLYNKHPTALYTYDYATMKRGDYLNKIIRAAKISDPPYDFGIAISNGDVGAWGEIQAVILHIYNSPELLSHEFNHAVVPMRDVYSYRYYHWNAYYCEFGSYGFACDKFNNLLGCSQWCEEHNGLHVYQCPDLRNIIPASDGFWVNKWIPINSKNSSYFMDTCPRVTRWIYDYNRGTTDEKSGSYLGEPGDNPIAGDFDRDGLINDIAIFRPSTGDWFYDYEHDEDIDFDLYATHNRHWGYPDDIAFAGDFNSDGYFDDVAVFRPKENDGWGGNWYYDYNTKNEEEPFDGITDFNLQKDGGDDAHGWGLENDKPLAGDFDDDGEFDDIGVYRPSTGNWYYDYNTKDEKKPYDGITDFQLLRDKGKTWGLSSHLPIAGDFDRDGKSDDVALFRPNEHNWGFDFNHDGVKDTSSGPHWGEPGDIPIAGDFDSDGTNDDIGVFRPTEGKWFYDYNRGTTNEKNGGRWESSDGGDIPITGDFDRDGKNDDVAILTPNDEWWYDYNHNGITNEIIDSLSFNGEKPFAGNFDTDEFNDDIGIFIPLQNNGIWYYDLDHDGNIDGPPIYTSWTTTEDIPFAGNFNPNDNDDRDDDVGVYRPSTGYWYYDFNHDGSLDYTSPKKWGLSSHLPIAGDFDRDGKSDDVALFRPNEHNWGFDFNHDGDKDTSSGPHWGEPGDIPIAGDFDSDGTNDDIGVFRQFKCDGYKWMILEDTKTGVNNKKYGHVEPDGTIVWGDLGHSNQYASNIDGFLNLLLNNNKFYDSGDPEGLLVSGKININGSASFDPFLYLPNSTLDIIPGDKGDYNFVLLDKDGEIISKSGFNVSFYKSDPNGGLIDFTYFVKIIEWSEDTKTIQLIDSNEKIIASREVSNNKPNIDLIYPLGGEVFNKDEVINIKWSASDEDGDPLFFYIDLSTNGGETWFPIEIDFIETEYNFDTSECKEGGDYLIRIRVSDGFNTDVDQCNETFSIISDDIIIGTISGGFGLKTTITNQGEEEITDLLCKIEIDAFKIFSEDTTTQWIESLKPGEKITLKTRNFVGFGPCTVTVSVAGISKTKEGFIIGSLIFLFNR